MELTNERVLDAGLEPTRPVTIRLLDRYEHYVACGTLQMKTWGEAFIDVVPPSLLVVSQKIGGLVAGAFDEADRMVGFVYSVPGSWHGTPIQWSHMLAVDPAWRGQRLGLKLKLFQRDLLIERGVEAVYWTYDPLEALNANLNLCRLGARPEEYLLDVYGDGSTSTLHRAIGTDRFVIAWSLRDALPPEHRLPAAARSAPIVDTAMEDGHVVPADAPLADAPWVRIEIPRDIQRVKAEAPHLAPRWRQVTRRAFTHYFASGYRVEGFYQDGSTGRCFYAMARPA